MLYDGTMSNFLSSFKTDRDRTPSGRNFGIQEHARCRHRPSGKNSMDVSDRQMAPAGRSVEGFQ